MNLQNSTQHLSIVYDEWETKKVIWPLFWKIGSDRISLWKLEY